METARIRPLGLLRLLARGLGPEGEAHLAFRADQSLRHVVETLGIPACEIGRAESGGELLSLELPAPDGAVIELAAVEEPVPLPARPRFAADVHLGRLARDLRLLGFDVLWRNDSGDEEIAATALAEARIVLTRDRGLLFRRQFRASRDWPSDAVPAMLVRSRDPFEQLVHACGRFGLAPLARPFSLCSSCGGPLEPADRESVSRIVPTVVAARYEEFFRCSRCGKPFWRGDHFRTIGPFLERLRETLGAELGGG